jgi:hypothetical protein
MSGGKELLSLTLRTILSCDPALEHDPRSWQDRLEFFARWREDWHGVGLGISRYMTMFKGKPEEREVAGLSVFLHLDVGRWGLGFDHLYYDGPICTFSLGPLVFINDHWLDCAEAWAMT